MLLLLFFFFNINIKLIDIHNNDNHMSATKRFIELYFIYIHKCSIPHVIIFYQFKLIMILTKKKKKN